MTAEALEVELEEAWRSLIRAYQPRTIYLTASGRLVWGERATYSQRLETVGTFTKAISLADFRDAVFATHDQRGRK